MISTETTAQTNNGFPSELAASSKHCVFRCGGSWFSVPAMAVREIILVPDIVHVPDCHRALVGLGNLRSEFVPVIALDQLLNFENSADSYEPNSLMVLEGSSTWSWLISEPAALESLETIVSPESRTERSQNIIVGTAMFRDRIVRVLDVNGLLATAQSLLEQKWNSRELRNSAEGMFATSG